MRICSNCEKRKPNNCFSPDKTKKSGLNSWCKECCAIYQKNRRSGTPYKKKKKYNLVNRPKANKTVRGKLKYHCCICDKWKHPSEFNKNSRERGRDKDYRCRDCSNALRRKATADLKKLVISKYGGKCACCGESNIGFLTIDHVNNDGNKHRKQIGSGSMYWWLKRKGFPKQGFQALCYNCNMGKANNNGICPHVQS